ncbi:flagellar filament capping protein FliD [Pseudoalteromonas xiamenensis]|uniref:flagellar filament capping protein FliD n=1 Tax=Pseudoalteromonas xiamenensis TaxID=882626 RepID=UPI0027E54527|nr:flagellar filament capping protein FliD [Pseudoalteromonas xiamenensis]WMN59375.1 flagellar filament capping protein FliD [Pseudoalteromonas xiamenensis]
MPLITSAGIGSGLDLESIISASISAERTPKLQSLLKKEDSLKVELSSLGEVKSAISKLQTTIKKLADIENFGKRTADIKQPSSGDLISVTPTSDISVGSFKVAVKQLAQGSRAVSADGAFSDSNAVVSASGGKLTFAAGPDKTFDLDVTAGMTLSELRDAINSSETNFGVTANIVNTGGTAGSKLVLTSSITGEDNDLVITSDSSELDAIETYDATLNPSGGMTIDQTKDKAQNAIISIDGLDVTSSSNTFKDAVQDMTIKAVQVSEDNAGVLDTAKLTIGYDRDSISTLVDEFITNYNNLIGQIGLQTRIGKPLNGDASMRSLSDQLIGTLSSTLTDAGPFESIFDIGIGVKKENYLEKSSLVRSLSEAMDDNFDNIGKAFAGENGVAKKMETLLANYLDSDGLIKKREDNLNVQIKDVGDDKLSLDQRMADLEAGLRKKYAGLDVLLAQMQQTQAYLGAQLANLPGFTKAKS